MGAYDGLQTATHLRVRQSGPITSVAAKLEGDELRIVARPFGGGPLCVMRLCSLERQLLLLARLLGPPCRQPGVIKLNVTRDPLEYDTERFPCRVCYLIEHSLRALIDARVKRCRRAGVERPSRAASPGRHAAGHAVELSASASRRWGRHAERWHLCYNPRATAAAAASHARWVLGRREP